ncbi:N-acetylmuramoyl-L-alanine amidase [Clostridium brassicae]|uniref:N-acetylmuramoyl-L-alanine amidase n=1 Tax=Clostridium brassicae TaxID=2999072 RepID=A0ABT4D9A0_9CLOT|nr:N-acetylmuramoyl-L-alanine amidase [Clostridium brassicae]MCY6958890.1 N-acetylmuramoyl-L-alanine amidase [Clostridium brassicae]
MIIGIDMGHPLRGGGTGAVGIRKETDCNREVGKKVIAKLQAAGHTVINCTTDYAETQAQGLKDRIKLANAQHLDLFVSIHFNSGGGHGTEVFTWSGKEFKEAKEVLNSICSLGYRNRGIKNGSNLCVIRHSKAKAMLIECSFIDSSEDMNRYNSEDLASAIAKGIVGQALSTSTIKATKPNSKDKYTVDYCLEFQKWYNNITQTKAPLREDNIYGSATEKALQTIANIIREF